MFYTPYIDSGRRLGLTRLAYCSDREIVELLPPALVLCTSASGSPGLHLGLGQKICGERESLEPSAFPLRQKSRREVLITSSVTISMLHSICSLLASIVPFVSKLVHHMTHVSQLLTGKIVIEKLAKSCDPRASGCLFESKEPLSALSIPGSTGVSESWQF